MNHKSYIVALLFCLPLVAIAEPTSFGMPATGSLKSAIIEALKAPAPIARPKPRIEVELGKLELLGEKGPITTKATDDTEGKKVVLYFWSIYCRDCVDQIKEIQTLKEELSKQNAKLIPIHLFESKEDKVASALTKLGISLPMYLAPESIRNLFSVNLLPAALILDESKEVIARFDGEFDEEGIKLELMSTVTELGNGLSTSKNPN